MIWSLVGLVPSVKHGPPADADHRAYRPHRMLVTATYAQLATSTGIARHSTFSMRIRCL